MTKFDVVKSVTSIKAFSRLIFNMARKVENVEDLEKELSMEISAEGLETIQSVAQSGNYPLSLDGLQ